MTETPTNLEGILKFWRHLFGGERGLLHVWTAKRDAGGVIDNETIAPSNFNYPDAAKSAAAWALEKADEGREVYFCAHLLARPKRTKENAAPVHTLWGDLDDAEIPNGELKPTAVVESSPGRYHVYWRLDTPIPPETAKQLNRRIAGRIGADPSGSDLSQLLRVPGTANRKNSGTPVEVALKTLDAERTYSAAVLDKSLPGSATHRETGSVRGNAKPVGEEIPNGSRNQILTSIAGTLRRRGLDERGILAALGGINQEKCQPPLHESEVAQIAASVGRYEPGELNGHRLKKPTPTSDSANPLLKSRVSLAEIIRDGSPPPDEQEKGVLIRGAVHHVYGPSDQGKSWTALWLIVQALRRGETVCYFDSENGKRVSAERLGADLGLEPDEAESLHYWPEVSLTLDEADRRNYREALEEIKPDLIVFDAWIYFLTNAGVGENDPDGIVSWSLAYTKPARDAGITTVLVDHTGHDESRARGSSRKKQEADVQWRIKKTAPFDRNTVGEITLYREKDREAWLPEAVKFSLGGREDGSGFLFKGSKGTTFEDEAHAQGLTTNALKTLQTLQKEPGLTFNLWKQQAENAGVPKGSFARAVKALKERSRVHQPDGKEYHLKEGEKEAVIPSDTESDTADSPSPEEVSQAGDTESDTEESRLDKQNSYNRCHRYHEPGISDASVEPENRYHGIAPLIGGDRDTDSDHPQPPAEAIASEVARRGSEAQKNLPYYLRGETSLQILTRSVLHGLKRDQDHWQQYAPLVEEVARDARKHGEGCSCYLCADPPPELGADLGKGAEEDVGVVT